MTSFHLIARRLSGLWRDVITMMLTVYGANTLSKFFEPFFFSCPVLLNIDEKLV